MEPIDPRKLSLDYLLENKVITILADKQGNTFGIYMRSSSFQTKTNNKKIKHPSRVLFLFREQFRVGRIELQQLLYILELRLRVLDVFIDTLQSL